MELITPELAKRIMKLSDAQRYLFQQGAIEDLTLMRELTNQLKQPYCNPEIYNRAEEYGHLADALLGLKFYGEFKTIARLTLDIMERSKIYNDCLNRCFRIESAFVHLHGKIIVELFPHGEPPSSEAEDFELISKKEEKIRKLREKADGQFISNDSVKKIDAKIAELKDEIKKIRTSIEEKNKIKWRYEYYNRKFRLPKILEYNRPNLPHSHQIEAAIKDKVSEYNSRITDRLKADFPKFHKEIDRFKPSATQKTDTLLLDLDNFLLNSWTYHVDKNAIKKISDLENRLMGGTYIRTPYHSIHIKKSETKSEDSKLLLDFKISNADSQVFVADNI